MATDNNVFSLLPNSGRELTQTENSALEARLWELLARRVRLYTLAFSTSLPKETAQELFRSVCFTLSEYLKLNSLPLSALLEGDINDIFDSALKLLFPLVEKGKQLYGMACVGAPEIQNNAYTETIEAIGGFFATYDFLRFAHRIPLFIDYPLAIPVSEKLHGIDYVCAYLRGIITENSFVSKFDAQSCRRLLDALCPDSSYAELPLNMYEPLLTNAVGAVIAQSEAAPLGISKRDRREIFVKLSALTRAERRSALLRATEELLDSLGIRSPREKTYAAKVICGILPRLENGMLNGRLKNIFISFD